MLDLSLYVIADPRACAGRPLAEVVGAAIAGGATVVQLRVKEATTREMLLLAEEIRWLTAEAGIPFIVNDRADVAVATDADGVHLGPEDLPVRAARRVLGPRRIIGASVGTVEEARQAEADGADYLGVGSVFPTASKPDAGEPIGVDGVRTIAQAVHIPIVGIGGITAANAPLVLQAGAVGVAVLSAVVGDPDPAGAARRLRGTITKVKGVRR